MCLWSEVKAFDGPHIEAMVISGVDRGQMDYGVVRGEKRREEVALWLGRPR